MELRKRAEVVGAHMEGHPLWSLRQTGTCGSPASAARQAVCWSLPQAHPQRHASATLRHVMLRCPVPRQWFAATWSAVTQQLAPPLHAAGKRQAWSMAAYRRVCKPVAEILPPGHHQALDGDLPLTLTARAAHITSAHRGQSQSIARSQRRCD